MCAAVLEVSRVTWAYGVALRRANDIERLYRARMRMLDRPYDPFPAKRLRSEIEKHQFGVYATLPRATARGVWRETGMTARTMGWVLILSAVGAAVVIH